MDSNAETQYVVEVKNQETSTFMKTLTIIVAILTSGYMAPWAVATFRNLNNTTSVFWVNLLLGWTLIGWVIALVMSLKNTENQILVITDPPDPNTPNPSSSPHIIR